MSDDPDSLRRIDTREFGKLVGHKLLGTCDAIYNIEGAEGLENDGDFCSGLDDTAMCCVTCSWWFEPHELNDKQECGECGEPDEE
jgi:hypothetical protein